MSDYLRYVDGYAMLDVERKNGEILISSEGSRAKFASIKPGDYPVPASPAARVSGDLDGDILIKELMEVLPYAATEESRPVLASVNMRLDVDKSALATADGFRLAVMPVPFKFPWKEEVNILPGTVAILAHLWKLAPFAPGAQRGHTQRGHGEAEYHLQHFGEKRIHLFPLRQDIRHIQAGHRQLPGILPAHSDAEK